MVYTKRTSPAIIIKVNMLKKIPLVNAEPRLNPISPTKKRRRLQ